MNSEQITSRNYVRRMLVLGFSFVASALIVSACSDERRSPSFIAPTPVPPVQSSNAPVDDGLAGQDGCCANGDAAADPSNGEPSDSAASAEERERPTDLMKEVIREPLDFVDYLPVREQ